MGWLKKLFKGNRNRNQVQEQPQDQQQETGPSNQEMIRLMETVPQVDGPSLLDVPSYHPSDSESEALQARLDGTITPEMEDREYEGTFGRLGKLKQDRSNAYREWNQNKTPEGKQKWKDMDGMRQNLLGTLGDQRKGWLDRRTKDENKGGKKLRQLGKGQVSETFVSDFGDGKESVFKGEGVLPDEMGRLGVDQDHNKGSSREILSSRISEMLKSNVIAKSEYAEMDGVRGARMDFAKGDTGVKTTAFDDDILNDLEAQEKATQLGLLGQKGWLESNGFDYSDPVLQKQLMELQINDMITGQIDRHVGNYHIDQGEDGQVKGVTGFDNDGSFAPEYCKNDDAKNSFGDRMGFTVGLPPILDEDQAKRIEELDPVAVYQEVAKELSEEEGTAAMLRLWELQSHVQKLRDEKRIVKEWNGETYEMLKQAGPNNSYVARDGMMSETLQQAKPEYEEWLRARQEGGIGGLGQGGLGLNGVGGELQKLTNLDDDVEKNQGEIVDQAPQEEEEPKKKKRGWFGKKEK